MRHHTDDTRATYDAVARRYADEFGPDLADKPLDRALLSALAEMARAGGEATPLVADLGCGPGYEARHLASCGLAVRGVDLSPAMVDEARRRHAGVAGLAFEVGSLLALPFADGSLAGAAAFYSIIHLPPEARATAYREIARVVRAGGVVLASFHVSSMEYRPGMRRHLDEWWGERVSLDGYFLAPEEVRAGFEAAGFALAARLDRGPATAREFPSQRCYMVLRREVTGEARTGP